MDTSKSRQHILILPLMRQLAFQTPITRPSTGPLKVCRRCNSERHAAQKKRPRDFIPAENYQGLPHLSTPTIVYHLSGQPTILPHKNEAPGILYQPPTYPLTTFAELAARFEGQGSENIKLSALLQILQKQIAAIARVPAPKTLSHAKPTCEN